MNVHPRNPQLEYHEGQIVPAGSSASQLSSSAGYATGYSSANEEPPRRNLVQAIWMRRWWVVFAVAVALIAGAVKYKTTTPMYQATAQLVVEQSRPNIIANDPAGVMTGTSNYLLTQVELIRSRRFHPSCTIRSLPAASMKMLYE